MYSRSRRTIADRLREEHGNVLATVMLVSLLVGSLSAAVLSTGRQADTASTSDRNHDLSLGVTEAGVNQAVAQIEARIAQGQSVASFPLSGTTPQGSYTGSVVRCPSAYDLCAQPPSPPAAQWFVIDAQGSSGGEHFGRSRRVRVTLTPPSLFPDETAKYALFSHTSVDLKNNDSVTGDVWANDSIAVNINNAIHGSLTSAQSWIDLSGADVDNNVWSGGYNPAGWAINNGANVGGWVKASSTVPSCTDEDHAKYTVALGSGNVGGDVTTLGQKTGSGSIAGSYSHDVCTPAAQAAPLPAFTYNRNNYDQATLHEFTGDGAVGAFQAWYGSNKSNMKGTFYVQDSAPSQANRLDLTGGTVTGDTTIVTNAPVFTGGIGDTTTTNKSFIVVSSYHTPTSTACDVNQDGSECSIHVKNNFSTSCATAALLYANAGPIAVKNNQAACGSIIGEGILVKNNQTLNYSPSLQRVIGFGPSTYVMGEWEELPPT